MKPPEIKKEQQVDELSFTKSVIGYKQSESQIKREFDIHQYQLNVLFIVQSFYEEAALPTKREINSLLCVHEQYKVSKTVKRAVEQGWIEKRQMNEPKIRESGRKNDGVYGMTEKGRKLVDRMKELALFNSG